MLKLLRACLSADHSARILRSHFSYGLMALLLVASLSTSCGKFFPSSDTLVAISVSPANASIQLTKTQQFTATGTFGNSSSKDISSSATWS